jgi:hypothetical protein
VKHVTRIGEMKTGYRNLVGKSEGDRSFGRRAHTWEVILNWIIRKDLVEVWVCIQLVEDKGQ